MKTRTQWGIRIPMRDGVELSADLYLPEAEGSYPTIISRTPYGKNSDVTIANSKFYASHGYSVLVVDVRGRGDSEGKFIPYRNEGLDGYDTIEWAAAQAWSDGNVGTMGGSYLGRIQWLAALQQPPHLKAMISAVCPSDPFVEWPTGVPTPHHLCWLFLTADRSMQNMHALDWHSIYDHLPLVTMDELTGREMPYWREEFEHVGLDAWWKQIAYQDKFEQLDLPVLHISGWYDDEQVGTPLNYIGMTSRAKGETARANQKMIMGPWDHGINRSSKLGSVEFGPDAVIDLRARQVRFFDRWLKGEENGLDAEPNVSLFVMGENAWREESEYPLARTEFTRFYLHSGGSANSRFGDGVLRAEEVPGTAAGVAATDTYEYDPSRPFPFLTDGTSSQIGGPDDYAALEQRADVLVYSTDVLETDTEVTGPIRMELFAASSAVDTDFMVKLLDVHPNGFVQRLTDGMVRARFRNGMEREELIEPGKVYGYEIDCWHMSHVFQAGHRIRIEVASSAFPKYDRNLNTGAPLGQTTEMVVAKQTVYHDEQYPSAIVLPIIPR
ncbi:CocE/NonD family hydrolase [Tumebacillus sp. ITR2]|uniref:CocE/NonD family hydrolase n=1 Tax=Tumebacillus amylolyticus TaxID=2801339 RepID=A0ABS1JFY0_9BACL|nr:CocE/NonD family hydrolase [Tumebacillus amylolyticus]MBL0389186.1 CocE/NonD family hydrolase [Tumebacillus amylolyticus]